MAIESVNRGPALSSDEQEFLRLVSLLDADAKREALLAMLRQLPNGGIAR